MPYQLHCCPPVAELELELTTELETLELLDTTLDTELEDEETLDTLELLELVVPLQILPVSVGTSAAPPFLSA